MAMIKIPYPSNEQMLLARANSIAGHCLADVADYLQISVPINLTKKKGWIGQLFEVFLGATAGSKAEQDFASLGIELKTIPVTQAGKVLETTFVCVAPLMDNHGVTWHTSHVKHKLSKVLWLPVEGDRAVPLAKRKIGRPILWSPTQDQEQQLKADWEELMDMITLGEVEKINASYGTYLQIRPKAANGRALTQAIGEDGQIILTRPRGFYLKKNLTQQVLINSGYAFI